MLTLFFKGFIIGLAIAAPVGPIGVLCIQRSLQNGFRVGLMTGMGAALADGTYGLIAGFSLTVISTLLIAHQFWIRLFGGLFLVYLGIKTFITPPGEKTEKNISDKSSLHAFGTSYLLTLTNPMTILSFVAIFAGLGLGTTDPDPMYAVILVLGIIVGSACWWIILSGGVAFILHHLVGKDLMKWINWISGIIIFSFGVFSLVMR